MNKKQLVFIMLLSFGHANASEYQKIYTQQLKQAEVLPTIAQEYFAGSKGISFDDGFTLDDILDKQRAELRAKLQTTFSIVIDSGVRVTNLAPYGMERVEGKANRYQVDYKKNPQWMEERLMFFSFSMPEYFDQQTRKKLRQMGLSSSDISKIANYIVENNINIINDESTLELIAKIEPKLQQAANKEEKMSIAINFSYLLHMKVQQNWNNWITKLLLQFSRIKQQIIFEHGKKEADFANISASHEISTKWLSLAKRIESGIFKEETLKRISSTEWSLQIYKEQK